MAHRSTDKRMFSLARTHPALAAWLAAALLGGLIWVAGPVVFVIAADLVLPLAASPVPAHLLGALVTLFHTALLLAAALTARGALRWFARRL